MWIQLGLDLVHEVATATPLRGLKTTFTTFFIYGHSSTNIANLAKIGAADVEIIGRTEIVKDFKNRSKTKARAAEGGLIKLHCPVDAH